MPNHGMKGSTKSPYKVIPVAGSRFLWVRIYVPKHLWQTHGESKRFSLKTTNPSEANKRALELSALWHARFRAESGEDKDALARLERSAEAVRRELRLGTLDPEDAADVFEAQADALLDELAVERGRDEETGYPLVDEAEERRLSRAIGSTRSAIANPSYRTLGEAIAEHLRETSKAEGVRIFV